MRVTKRLLAFGIAGALLVAGLNTHTASAAYQETPFRESITTTISILRTLHKQIEEAEAGRAFILGQREYTQRQYDLQKKLYDAEVARGDAERIAYAEKYLKGLEDQLAKINALGLEKIYDARVADAKANIAKYTTSLDMQMTEYEALFGKRPKVETRMKAPKEPRTARPPVDRYELRFD